MALASWMVVAALTAAAPAAPQDASLAAGQRAWRGFHAEIERNGTPRELALAARLPWLDDGDPSPHEQEAGKNLRLAAQRAPTDEVVQWLWANAPAQLSGCDARSPCPERVMASARLTPDNARSWVPVLEDAVRRKDPPAIDAALERMAQARYYGDTFALLVDAYRDMLGAHPLPSPPPGSELPARGTPERALADSTQAVALASLELMSSAGLLEYCNAKAVPAVPPANLMRCQRIGQLMLDAPAVLQRKFGNTLLRRSGGEPVPGLDRQVQWLATAMVDAQHDTAELNRYFDDLHTTQSEVRAAEFALQRAGKPLTPPADWVFAYGQKDGGAGEEAQR